VEHGNYDDPRLKNVTLGLRRRVTFSTSGRHISVSHSLPCVIYELTWNCLSAADTRRAGGLAVVSTSQRDTRASASLTAAGHDRSQAEQDPVRRAADASSNQLTMVIDGQDSATSQRAGGRVKPPVKANPTSTAESFSAGVSVSFQN